MISNFPRGFKIGPLLIPQQPSLDSSFADRKNRALVLKSLLAGVATQDLELAVELFSIETRRLELLEAGSAVIPLALEHAVAQEDDNLIREDLIASVIFSSLLEDSGLARSRVESLGLEPGKPLSGPLIWAKTTPSKSWKLRNTSSRVSQKMT